MLLASVKRRLEESSACRRLKANSIACLVARKSNSKNERKPTRKASFYSLYNPELKLTLALSRRRTLSMTNEPLPRIGCAD